MERKQIPGFRRYDITLDGQVHRNDGKERRKGKPIKHSFHRVKGKEYPNGYLYVTLLCRDKEDNGIVYDSQFCTPIALHRLLAITFIPNPNGYRDVNHKDGDKLNNTLDNLEWCTHKDNIQHAVKAGLWGNRSGEKHGMFGKKQSVETKHKQSKAKIGEKHPKFKGWYAVNGFKYTSLQQAAIQSGVTTTTISRWVKSKSKALQKLKSTTK